LKAWLVIGHDQSHDALGSKVVGEGRDVESTPNPILIIFHLTWSVQKCGNPDGQTTLEVAYGQ